MTILSDFENLLEYIKYMSDYIRHLQELYTPETFKRKKDYIDYNLGSYLSKIGYKKLKVLEVGPGMGEFESYLNDKGVVDIDIADNDQGILDYSLSKYKINKAILTKKIEDLDKKINKYNLIFLMQVLEHIPIDKYSETVKILFKHLERGGFLIIVVPNGNNPLGLIERYGDLQHTGCFTEQSLKDLINVSGLKNYQIRIRGYEIPTYSIINVIRVLLQKILHLFLLLIMIINGGIYFKTMTPNIMMAVNKK